MTLRGDDLAYATLDYIREHPEEWNQGFYFFRNTTAFSCSTTACFAGRAVVLSGEFTENRHTGIHAAELLGWTDVQADYVFRCFTTDFGVLERHVKAVLNGEVT